MCTLVLDVLGKGRSAPSVFPLATTALTSPSCLLGLAEFVQKRKKWPQVVKKTRPAETRLPWQILFVSSKPNKRKSFKSCPVRQGTKSDEQRNQHLETLLLSGTVLSAWYVHNISLIYTLRTITHTITNCFLLLLHRPFLLFILGGSSARVGCIIYR